MWCIVVTVCLFFFFKQKTAYEMRISDWSSDVCSSDLRVQRRRAVGDADVRKVDRTFADDARRARRDRLVDEFVPVGRLALHRDEEKIGRASCRERVCQYV